MYPRQGRWVNLRMQLARFGGPGPIWAALCGAVASGELTFSGPALFSLLSVLFLVDPLWGFLWDHIVGVNWGIPSSLSPSLLGDGLRLPPYTAPNSPGGRLFRWLDRALAWWRGALWPQLGSELSGLAIALPLTAVLSFILGLRVIILTSIGLSLMALLSWRRLSPRLPRAIIEVGLAWLAGQGAFGPLSWPSSALAAAYVGAYYACLALEEGERPLILLNGAQAAAVTLLVCLKRPLMAGLVGLTLLPQMLLQPYLREGGTAVWYLQRTGPFLMAGMLLAALAM